MTDSITVTGVVGTDPNLHVTTQGLAITSFRLASTRRYFDRAKGSWEDGETNWYTISTFRQLAQNTVASIRKGERVVVHGRLRLRAWENGEKSGMAVEIEADAIGHDLTWGTTELTKVRLARESSDGGQPAEDTAVAWPGTEPATVGTGSTDGAEDRADHAPEDPFVGESEEARLEAAV